MSSDSPVASSSSELQPPEATELEGCKPHARRRRSLLRRIVQPLRGLARWVVRSPERLRHDRRRREALERLEAMPTPDAILFLCIGNICRSPYAQRRFLECVSPGTAARLVVRSAGFGRWDRRSPTEALEEAARRGVDLTTHRSQGITHELVDNTDLFVVTAEPQARRLRREQGVDPRRILHLGDLDPEPIRQRTIVDPWGKSEDVFRQSYGRIDRCVAELARALERKGQG